MTLAAEANPSLSSFETHTPTSNRYIHVQFTEAESPALAQAAWRLHAQGYVDSGFVTEDAIGADGFLSPDIDKSRGPNAKYHLALDHDGAYEATMREINLTAGMTYEDHAAYKLCKDGLYPWAEDQLAQLQAQGTNIKEIAALARPLRSSPLAVFEIIRKAMHASLGKDEVWLFSIVADTHDSLVHAWGADNLPVIGADTTINDPRVRKHVALRPALLFPDTFNETLLKSLEQANSAHASAPSRQTDEAMKTLSRNFLFFTEGLSDDQLGMRVAHARKEMLAATERPHIEEATAMTAHPETTYEDAMAHLGTALAEHMQKPDIWAEPQIFDLSVPADADALRTKFDDGVIGGVLDATNEIANELFDIRHPAQTGDAELRRQFVDGIEQQGARFGRWVLFPWSQRLVRYADAAMHREVHTARHKNLITKSEQAKLYGAAVLIGGLSVGSSIAYELSMSGIGGTLIMGDPDTISPSNLSRVRGGFTAVGRGKIDHVAMAISETDPYVRQVHLDDGITEESLDSLTGDNKPAIIFDAVDSLRAKIIMRRWAQREGVPLVMVTDAGKNNSIADVERHDLGEARPFHGKLSKATIDRIYNGTATRFEIMLAMAKIVGIRNVSPRMLQSFMEAGRTLAGIPQLGRAATKGGSLAASIAEEVILGRRMPTGRYKASTRKTLHLQRDMNLLGAAGVYAKFYVGRIAMGLSRGK